VECMKDLQVLRGVHEGSWDGHATLAYLFIVGGKGSTGRVPRTHHRFQKIIAVSWEVIETMSFQSRPRTTTFQKSIAVKFPSKKFHKKQISSREKRLPSNISMSFNIDCEIGSETASINDVLLCWESEEGEDDSDSIRMIHKIREDFLDDSCDINIIPVSPRTVPPSVPVQCNSLEELMKKYPAFVPKRLPKVPVKRSRPVCTFVNFLGTRDQPKAVKKAAAKPMMVKAKVFEPSPYPTDAPSGVTRPNKKLKTLTKDLPVVTPTGAPKQRQKIFEASPMPIFAPTIARKAVSPTP
jgi:hypothetical protein